MNIILFPCTFLSVIIYQRNLQHPKSGSLLPSTKVLAFDERNFFILGDTDPFSCCRIEAKTLRLFFEFCYSWLHFHIASAQFCAILFANRSYLRPNGEEALCKSQTLKVSSSINGGHVDKNEQLK